MSRWISPFASSCSRLRALHSGSETARSRSPFAIRACARSCARSGKRIHSFGPASGIRMPSANRPMAHGSRGALWSECARPTWTGCMRGVAFSARITRSETLGNARAHRSKLPRTRPRTQKQLVPDRTTNAARLTHTMPSTSYAKDRIHIRQPRLLPHRMPHPL